MWAAGKTLSPHDIDTSTYISIVFSQNGKLQQVFDALST